LSENEGAIDPPDNDDKSQASDTDSIVDRRTVDEQSLSDDRHHNC
jgi:hypothetical protein